MSRQTRVVYHRTRLVYISPFMGCLDMFESSTTEHVWYHHLWVALICLSLLQQNMFGIKINMSTMRYLAWSRLQNMFASPFMGQP